MTVKEIFPTSQGIMYAISEAGNYNFSRDMDLRLIATCGKRLVTPIVDLLLETEKDDFIGRITALILSEYQESWDKIHETLIMKYNPLSASQYNETEITDDDSKNTDTNKEVKQNDVSTSDSLPDNFISDGKSTNDTQGSSTSKSSTKRTLTRTSNSTSYKPVDLLKSEIEMRIENKFISRVLEDVKNYIAMPIY